MIPVNQNFERAFVDENGVLTQWGRNLILGLLKQQVIVYTGTPEGNVDAPVTTICMDDTATTSGTATTYIKQITANTSGDGTTGWLLM